MGRWRTWRDSGIGQWRSVVCSRQRHEERSACDLWDQGRQASGPVGQRHNSGLGDGQKWSAGVSGTADNLNSIFGTADSKRLWVVGDDGTDCADERRGELERPNSNGTQNRLWSIVGTSDGKSLWAVGDEGTRIQIQRRPKLEPSHQLQNEDNVRKTSDRFLRPATAAACGPSAITARSWNPTSGKPWKKSDQRFCQRFIWNLRDQRRQTAVGGRQCRHDFESADGKTWTPHASGARHRISSIVGNRRWLKSVGRRREGHDIAIGRRRELEMP